MSDKAKVNLHFPQTHQSIFFFLRNHLIPMLIIFQKLLDNDALAAPRPVRPPPPSYNHAVGGGGFEEEEDIENPSLVSASTASGSINRGGSHSPPLLPTQLRPSRSRANRQPSQRDGDEEEDDDAGSTASLLHQPPVVPRHQREDSDVSSTASAPIERPSRVGGGSTARRVPPPAYASTTSSVSGVAAPATRNRGSSAGSASVHRTPRSPSPPPKPTSTENPDNEPGTVSLCRPDIFSHSLFVCVYCRLCDPVE